MSRADVWLKLWRALVGTGIIGWELGVDDFHHWPILIPCLWMLGAPLELLIRFFTSGRVQIDVHGRDGDKDDDQ